jgi:hypothetical protein
MIALMDNLHPSRLGEAAVREGAPFVCGDGQAISWIGFSFLMFNADPLA